MHRHMNVKLHATFYPNIFCFFTASGLEPDIKFWLKNLKVLFNENLMAIQCNS